MTNCPDCGSPLGKSAFKCRCGWKGSESTGREVIPCAYAPCSKPAICRIFTRGWTNVCIDHYTTANFTRPIPDSPVIKEVLEAFRNSKYAKRVSEVGVDKARAEIMREPGEDKEESAA